MFKKKRPKNEKGEELETRYEVFKRNYDNVPGFKALVKLSGYFIFLAIIVIMVNATGAGKSTAKPSTTPTNNETQTTTTSSTTSKKVVYADILNALRQPNVKVAVTVTIDGAKFVVEGQNYENTFEGYYSDATGTKKFAVRDNNIYERVLDQETMNNELFGSIELDFIVPKNLVAILTSKSAIKTLDGDTVLYNYEINKNNVDYKVTTFVKDEKCYKVEIKSANTNYLITYE